MTAQHPTPGQPLDIPVDGGTLRVMQWGPEPSGEPVVLAVHGVTANHRAWEPVVAALPGRRVLAPDLRGRGRSADLPGPWGLARHAADLVAVLDAAGVAQATVIGHSMGGFVAAALQALAPERVGTLLLVDGGLPLTPPDGDAPPPSAAAVLGPALARLSMTFADHAAYHDFWKVHPAFADDWSPAVERYVDYDLVGEPGALHSSVRAEAVEADFTDQLEGTSLRTATAALEHKRFGFLRAPRGLQGELPGLYPPERIAAAESRLPGMAVSEVPDVNHYTILLSERGAAAVAAALRSPR